MSAPPSAEYCCECHSVILDVAMLKHCKGCREPMHQHCGVKCGAEVLKRGEHTDDDEPVHERCDVRFCERCATRRPICRYPSEGGVAENNSDDELRHGAGVPLCAKHVDACAFCHFALCDHHNSDDYLHRNESKLYECRNCNRTACCKHYEMCEDCEQVECKPCGGLRLEDDWNDVYDGNFACKHHRFMQHIEACVSPPDSPEGEPMTMATRRRLALDENDPRINN